jgi:2-C-methyl-D-erythritol 4-phosphate cytidylyltransferase/2-C-methyl-D-erythritol 2,4-cyclodiphosphate synthase
VAAILAAGRGERFGVDKTQILLRSKPLWRYSFDTFLEHPDVDGVGIVCSADSVERYRSEAPEAAFVAAGGEARQDSAKVAFNHANDFEVLMIHDAARPFVTHKIISDVLAGVSRSGAAAPAVSVVDTIRQDSEMGRRLLDRDQLFAMQTPQAARIEMFHQAFAKAKENYTDDVELLQNAGIATEIVSGEPRNFKITTPEDLIYASGILGTPERRTGFGYDIHPFSSESGRKLYLGGVHFENAKGLEGHSDADVLLHAVVDALLGAASLGDIGTHFPNTDPQYRNRDSIFFLEQARVLLESSSWRILNVDATVVAEFPKMSGKVDAIRSTIATALGIDVRRISIKATTNEGLGALGRGEGIAAYAVATISESV